MEIVQEGAAVVRPAVRVAGRGAHHELVKFWRDTADQRRGRRHVAVHRLVGHRHRGGSAVRELTGEHLEQHDPGRVDVAAGVSSAVGDLFGGEVADRSHHDALGDGLGRLGDRPSQPEIRDLHPAVVAEQDVFGLDVPVDDAGRVRGGQRLEHRLDDLGGLGGGQPASGAKVLAQRLAAHQFHHQVDHRTRRTHRAALVEHRHRVGRVQPGGRGRLAMEPGYEVRVMDEVGVHDFEGDQPVEPAVVRDVHRRHTAYGESLLGRVPAVEQAPDDRVGDGGIHVG